MTWPSLVLLVAGTTSFDYVVSDSFGATSKGTVYVDVSYETDTVTNVEVLRFDDAEITVTSFEDGMSVSQKW